MPIAEASNDNPKWSDWVIVQSSHCCCHLIANVHAVSCLCIPVNE